MVHKIYETIKSNCLQKLYETIKNESQQKDWKGTMERTACSHELEKLG